MRDDWMFELLYFILEASLGVLVTYPLMYHVYFMCCCLISRVCER
jgi:hypothetical protein